MKTSAIIFDMDGILIDSEPHWAIAGRDAFASVGVVPDPGEEVLTMGVRPREVVAFWREKHPWTGATNEEVLQRILDAQIAWVLVEGKKEPGVDRVFALAKKLGLKTALASSSPKAVIDAVVRKLGLADLLDAVYSAEFEKRGKPAPDVFLHAAEALGVAPSACVVIEDSINGIAAAIAAGMRCIAIPDPHFIGRPEVARADFVVGSLEEVGEEMLA